MRTFHLLQNHLPDSRQVLSWPTSYINRPVHDHRKNPFEFSFTLASTPPNKSSSTHGRSILQTTALPDFLSVMDSVTHVIGSPRVFGLQHDSSSYVRVRKTSTSLLDAGANICLTGDLQLLVNIVEIPPLPISVAITGDTPSLDDCCTRRGYLPLQLSDGTTHWQLCFYCKNAVKTIISPQAILESSDVFASWTQTGFKDDCPVQIRFDSHDGLLTMRLDLDQCNVLYYCPTDICGPSALRVATPLVPNTTRRPSRFTPTSKSKQVESEVWLLRLGSPGVHQLNALLGNVTGIPSVFEYHPFRFINFKEQARIRKQAAQRSAVRTTERRKRFYMDFGFRRASAADYS